MKNTILFFLLTFQLSNLSAQRNKPKVPDFQFGIRTGNHITLPSIDEQENFTHKSLLRYSAGILFRKTIYQMKRRKQVSFAIARRGVFAIDFGVNAVFSGYHYKIGELLGTTEQLSWEVPLMAVLYDRENIMIPRKWQRKGLTTFARFGPKASYLPNRTISKTIQKDAETVVETIESGGWNFIWSINGGIVQNHKSGNTSFLEIGWNQGFIPITKGVLDYSNSTDSKQGDIAFRGSYLSINVSFLFAPKNWKYVPIGKGKLPKTIFNPRYL